MAPKTLLLLIEDVFHHIVYPVVPPSGVSMRAVIMRTATFVVGFFLSLGRIASSEAQTITDVRVSNHSAFSVTIGWATDVFTDGHVNYGLVQPDQRADDVRGPNVIDDIHYVRIEGLEQNTTYLLEVVSGETAAGGLRFTTAPVDPIGPPGLNLTGRIASPPDQPPPPDDQRAEAIVYISISHDGETSLPLSALVPLDREPAGAINLGNLKRADTREPFIARTRDVIQVFAQGGLRGIAADISQRIQDIDATFQDLGTLTLRSTTESGNLRFEPGLNLIAPPFFLYPPVISTGLLASQPGVTEVARWLRAQKFFESTVRGDEGPIGPDFSLELADGYFVRLESDSPVSYPVFGVQTQGPVTTDLLAGLNIVSISDPSLNLTAFSLLDNIPESVEVTRFDRLTQLYSGAIHIEERSLGEDFPITPGEGYFARVRMNVEWTPSGVLSRLIARPRNTGIRYGGLRLAPPTSPASTGTQSAVPDVLVSNLSSASAAISWRSEAASRIRYGVSPTALDYEVTEVHHAGGIHRAQLTGLGPETTYYIQTVSEDGSARGAPSAFTTSKTGLGVSYSLFGRVFERDGVTPASGTFVTMTVVRGAERSLPLSTVTDAEGFWTVNLGNLKGPLTGASFPWREGDTIEILAQASGGDEARDVSQQITGISPKSTVPVYKTTSSQENGQDTAVPRNFTLGQNYPNPFNPATRIDYTVATPQPAYTTLTVYNVLGQVIKRLVTHVHDPGHYTVVWDATDARGRPVSSGVYFYQLESGSFKATKAMTLLR